MNYKNIEIKIHDKISCTILHVDFIFAYTHADSVVKDEYIGKYSNFGGLQCNFVPESKEYKDLYDYCLKVAQNTLKTVYEL